MHSKDRWFATGWFLMLLALMACAATSLSATEFDPAKLAQIKSKMQSYVDQKVIAGAVTVVGSKDGVASLEAVGFQKLETKQPMPADALFRIASMTKPITSIGIMILQEEGKLSVDDLVEKHLPEFRGQRIVASRDGDNLTLKKPARAITIRDLLTLTRRACQAGFRPAWPICMCDVSTRWRKRSWSVRNNRSTSSLAASGRTAMQGSIRWVVLSK